jgi:hypothetical protein
MHNPPVRLRPVDGMLRLLGQFPSGDGGSLLLWSHQIAPDGSLVQATQLYEWYDETGLLTGKRKLDVRFRLVSHDEFRAQIESAGFTVEALYGDYERASFDPTTSPVMIWCLRRN